MIAPEMTSTVLTTINGKTEGKMWRRMMYTLPAPMARARSTNLRSLTDRTWERTSRALPVQYRIPITIMMVSRPGPMIATSTMANGKSGMTSTISVKRISRFSTRPP